MKQPWLHESGHKSNTVSVLAQEDFGKVRQNDEPKNNETSEEVAAEDWAIFWGIYSRGLGPPGVMLPSSENQQTNK